MKRVIGTMGMVVGFWFTAGMGDAPKDAVIVPRDEVNYSARVIDLSGSALDLEWFSCEGRTFLPGTIGRAQITIDFSKIAAVDVAPRGEAIRAGITLRDGETVELDMDRNRFFYGEASFANVRIHLPDIRSISISGSNRIEP